MRLRSCLVAALIMSFGWGWIRSVASAQEPAASGSTVEDRTDEAKGLFSAGRAAFDAGRYQDAVDYFQRSYTLSRRAALLYNIAISYDRLRDDKKALEAYEQYLSLKPDASNRAELETRVAAIRAALKQREAQTQPEPTASAEPPSSSPEPSAAEPSPTAPTPAQVAASQVQGPGDQAGQAGAAADTESEPAHPARGNLLGKWWFWTAVGVVVAGSVTATAIGLSGGQKSATPLAPTSGVLVTTLRTAP